MLAGKGRHILLETLKKEKERWDRRVEILQLLRQE